MTEPLVQIKNLTIGFPVKSGYRSVVSRANFDVAKSSCVGLVGESGSGKSLTGLSIMQLLPLAACVDAESEIWFAGANLLNKTEHEMRTYRGIRIGMIFQDAMAAFNPVLTIAKQIDEILQRKTHLSKIARRDRALDLLDKVGIRQTKRCYFSYPHQLSGGMRQRAMIAMALSGAPDFIIADEPTTALDVTLQAQIIDLLCHLRETEKLTLLFITHDLGLVSNIADNIVVMQKGYVVEKNCAKQFFYKPEQDYSKKLLGSILSREPRQKHIETTGPVLTVRDLKVYFSTSASQWWPSHEKVKAVDGVDFVIERGKTLALVGESGSGKTTVAKAIIRLLKPTAGEVLLNDLNLDLLSAADLRKARKDIQIIFQDPYVSLNPRLMIADSIMEGLSAQKIIHKKSAQIARVDELLLQVGLSPDCKWRYPHEFSGGEKQRICIARAIALRPKLLILDEPTSALDVSIQMQVLDLLDSLQKQQGISYLLITHDLSVVAYLAHQMLVMYQGVIVERGATCEVMQNPKDKYTQKLLSALRVIKV